MKTIFVKFIKFGIVGFLGMLIDFSVTYLLKEKLKINKFIANSIGFTLAASSNYLFNRIWTFNSQNKEYLKEYSDFFAVSLVGLLINNSSLFLFNKMLNKSSFIENLYKNKLADKYEKRETINFYCAKFLAMVVTIAWNFFANYFYTFAK